MAASALILDSPATELEALCGTVHALAWLHGLQLNLALARRSSSYAQSSHNESSSPPFVG